MKITKIEVTKSILIDNGKEALDEWKESTTTYSRSTFPTSFDDHILRLLPENKVRGYAAGHLDMVDEDECPECDCGGSVDIHEVLDEILEYEMDRRGYFLIRPQSITDAMRAEKLKELMEL